VDYTTLGDSQMRELVRNRIIQIEADHYNLELNKAANLAAVKSLPKERQKEAKANAQTVLDQIEEQQAMMDAHHAELLAELDHLGPEETEETE